MDMHRLNEHEKGKRYVNKFIYILLIANDSTLILRLRSEMHSSLSGIGQSLHLASYKPDNTVVLEISYQVPKLAFTKLAGSTELTHPPPHDPWQFCTQDTN